MTYLDKIDESFEFTKAWLIKEFGDHMSVHNALSNLKTEVLSHAAEHFGEGTANPTVGVNTASDSSSSSTETTVTPGIPPNYENKAS